MKLVLTILHTFIYSKSDETEANFIANLIAIFQAQKNFEWKKLIQFCIWTVSVFCFALVYWQGFRKYLHKMCDNKVQTCVLLNFYLSSLEKWSIPIHLYVILMEKHPFCKSEKSSLRFWFKMLLLVFLVSKCDEVWENICTNCSLSLISWVIH